MNQTDFKEALSMDTLSTELFDKISKIPCINSHSHISPEIDLSLIHI